MLQSYIHVHQHVSEIERRYSPPPPKPGRRSRQRWSRLTTFPRLMFIQSRACR